MPLQSVAVRVFLAYLDPGSGSMIMQALAGGIAGFAVVGKMYWRRIKRVFVRRDAGDTG
jgi:outer membrane lipoprotein SlyB